MLAPLNHLVLCAPHVRLLAPITLAQLTGPARGCERASAVARHQQSTRTRTALTWQRPGCSWR